VGSSYFQAMPTLREPLRFSPIVQDKLWGGNGLWKTLRKGEPDQTTAGEAWELSDRAGESNTVHTGLFSGKTFRQVFIEHSREILGTQWRSNGDPFPLLYKFIAAREALSVQVHPGSGSPLGEAKTECWFVVAAPPDASLILGVNQSLPRDQMLQLLSSPHCEQGLRREPVSPGDVVFIPAGTVHAITPGMLIYEVQQNSDTTFRLYDWGRVDAHGQPRALHLRESAEVMDLRVHDKHKITPLFRDGDTHHEAWRVACPYFTIVHFGGFKAPALLRQPDRFRVLTVISGSFALEWPGDSMAVGLGETVLLPASLAEAQLSPLAQNSEILLSFIPDLASDVIAPLRAAGHSDAAISALGGFDGLPHSAFAHRK
jgi:mannose-6-phosphate isomerase